MITRRKISAQWLAKFTKEFLFCIFWFKKVQDKLKIVHQITRRQKLSAQWSPKTFKGF